MAKRIFDLFFATLGCLILSPLLLVLALGVRLSSRGPVLFRSRRVGRFGKEFFLFKFRTMTKDAPLKGPAITIGKDRRITPLGAVLRRCKVDELPQLLNVIKGEMSLVGPRPEVPVYVRLYSPEQRAILNLVPGITDPASVKYALESELLGASKDPEVDYTQHVMVDKINLALGYAVRANVWTDFALILKTLVRIARRPARTDEGGERAGGRGDERPSGEAGTDLDMLTGNRVQPASHLLGLTGGGSSVESGADVRREKAGAGKP